MINVDNTKFIKNSTQNLIRIKKMKEEIAKSGGFFCQYRPCRMDENIIYDIENIIHGVVYARSPLYMNDPFDSEIGFSTEKVIDDILDMFLLDFKPEVKVENLLRFIIKNRMLGNFADLIKGLNSLKKEFNILMPDKLTSQQINYITHHIEAAIKKQPKHIQKIFNKKNITNILFLILQIKELEITEQNIYDLVLAQDQLIEAISTIDKIKETVFEEAYKKFLATINISCFTASGWKNALMWAHYANSYAGICIEYDFNKLKDFVGFIYKVDYTQPRPIISIKDLGSIKEGKFEVLEITDETAWKLINYMLVKDKVWNYENEWRIIDVQEKPDSPSFISLPFIKSITMGPKINPLIKNWIINICSDKNIDCYILKLSYDTFEIDRTLIDIKNYNYNLEEDCNFLNHLSDKINGLNKTLKPLTDELNRNYEDQKFDYDLLLKALSVYEDIVISSYFTKNVVNRMTQNNKELLVYYGESIKEAIKNFDEIKQHKDDFVSLKEQTLSFVSKGIITVNQKKSLDKKLNSVINIIDYYSEHQWSIDGLN